MSLVQYGWAHSFTILVNVRSNDSDREYTQIPPKLDADDISKHADLLLWSIREKSESLFRVKGCTFSFQKASKYTSNLFLSVSTNLAVNEMGTH